MAKVPALWRKTEKSPWYHRRRVEADAVERLRGLFRSGVIAIPLGTRDDVEADSMAGALEISRRLVADYRKDRPIPRHIGFATRYLETLQKASRNQDLPCGDDGLSG